MSLGFNVISVKQMTTHRRSSAERTTTVSLPLFLITLPRTTKSQEMFNLTSILENKNTFVRNYVCVTFILARGVLSLLHVSAHMGHLQVSRI
jgi:hypothetical protein